MAWSKEKQREYMRRYYAEKRDEIRAKQAEWRNQNRERHLSLAREYHHKNRDAILAKKREYSKRTKERRAHKLRFEKYGITQEQFGAMMLAQHGLCAVCRVSPAVVVDHDHGSGVVRAILCSPCNTSLGLLKEDEARIIALLRYVSKHKSKADAA